MENNEISFQEMMDMDERIKRLYCLAKMIGRKNVKSFFANAIWYTLFKPALNECVGWERKINPRGKFTSYTVDECLKNKHITDLIHDPGSLGTTEAYRIAYKHIYDALPNCGPNCSCF